MLLFPSHLLFPVVIYLTGLCKYMSRIFIISIAGRPVDINMYGGIEAIVYYLAKEFVQMGFDVRVAAPEGSRLPPGVEYVPTVPAIEPEPPKIDWGAREAAAERVYRKYMRDVDIVCDHSAYCYPYRHHKHVSHTLHSANPWDCIKVAGVKNRLPVYIAPSKELAGYYKRFTTTPYVIHHGIDIELYPFKKTKKDYFLFLNRITQEKGAMDFIKICEETGVKGIMAGTVPKGNYSEQCIDYAKKVGVEVRGHVPLTEKIRLLSNAKALIAVPNPSYLEAWYLGATEAMACGTPVIALANGGLKEQIENGVTGFLCKSIEEIKRRIWDVDMIDPEDCRNIVATRFSSRRMARNYLLLYSRLGWL